MTGGFFQAELETPRGVFSVIFHRYGIYELFFPGCRQEQRYPPRELPWPRLAGDLNRYFRGEKVAWGGYPLDMGDYPPFQRRLLEVVRRIPYGAVCTYREAAERAGSTRGWRAAGQALKANRHPLLVPCHRVVAAGGLGGFSGPPGWKQMLLELEGRTIEQRGGPASTSKKGV